MARYNLELEGETSDAVDRLAERAAWKADAIRKAISVAAWFDETERSGKKLLVEDENGRIREVHWR